MKRVWKITLCVLLTGCLFAASALAESATVKLQYADGSLRIRAGAGTSYATRGYLHDGDTIEVLSEGSTWSKIRSEKGTTGYIRNAYFEYDEDDFWDDDDDDLFFDEDDDAVFTRGRTVYVSEVGGTLNVRKGPGTSYGRAGYTEHGDAITVLESGETWSRIRVDDTGVTGYIMTKYIYGAGTAGWSQDAWDTDTYDPGIVVTKYKGSTVNIRSRASSTSTCIDSVKQGDTLKVTGTSGNWYQVLVNGHTGYIYKTYLKVGLSAKTTVSLNVRTGPGTTYKRVTTLAKNTSVTLLSIDGNWGYVKYSGSKTGYVSLNYLKY